MSLFVTAVKKLEIASFFLISFSCTFSFIPHCFIFFHDSFIRTKNSIEIIESTSNSANQNSASFDFKKSYIDEGFRLL